MLRNRMDQELVEKVWNDIDKYNLNLLLRAHRLIEVLKPDDLIILVRPGHHCLVLEQTSLNRFNDLLCQSVVLRQQKLRQRL